MEHRGNGLLCLAAGAFYLLNRGWLIRITDGWVNWFLICYANDLAAGAAILAWSDLLLDLGGLPGLRSWRQTVPLLLICGLVWEVLTPLWKPGAVFDLWDFTAYQMGGAIWLILANLRREK